MPLEQSQGYSYWNDPQAGGGIGGNPQEKFGWLSLIPAAVGLFGSLFGGHDNPQVNTQRPVMPQSPGNIPMDQLMSWLPQYMQLFEQMGGQGGLQGMLAYLQRAAGQDFERQDWLLNRAQDLYGQGRSMDDYLMNLYGDVLGIDFYSTPGATERTWLPTGPGGYYSQDGGANNPPLPDTIAAPGYPNTFTPQPPPGGWTGNNGNASTGDPGNGGPYTPKLMPDASIGEGTLFTGGAGFYPNNQPPTAAPPGSNQHWTQYGEGEGPGQWLTRQGPATYGWRPDPKGFDPNNPTTWGLVAPQAAMLASDRDREMQSMDAYGIRGGELERSKKEAGQRYFTGVSGLKQQLVQDALNFMKSGSVQKMLGAPTGENQGAAGQGFGGLSNYLQSLLGGSSGAFGAGLGYNSGLYNAAMGNYWNQQNFNQGIANQNNDWWRNFVGNLGQAAYYGFNQGQGNNNGPTAWGNWFGGANVPR